MESKFLELEISEIESKLRELLFSRQPIKIWKDSNFFTRLEIASIDDLKIAVTEFDFFSEGEVYFVSFSLRGINYYFRAVGERVDSKIVLNNLGNIFRAERRRSIRILMHPRIIGFLYFQFVEESVEVQDNVLSLNRTNNDEKKLFKQFRDELKDITKIGGVKILDLSEEGLSFVTSHKDAKLLEATKPNSAMAIVNNKSVMLENIEYVYNVDYLNQRIEGIGFKKIGVKFGKSQILADLITSLDDNSYVLTSLDEEFTSFISEIEE